MTNAAVHLFENHDEAHYIWIAAGFRDATVVHVDPHHDLEWLDDPVHLQIGNYLCQALKNGTVRDIRWVVPDGALSDARVRRAVTTQIQTLQSTYPTPRRPLRESASEISVELLDGRLVVCDHVPVLSTRHPLLLDVDIDFLLTPAADLPSGLPAEKPWLSARACVARFEGIAERAAAITIAYSVEGGYTPIGWKFLGDELAARFRGAGPDALHGFECLSRADALQRSGRIDDADRMLSEARLTLPNPAAAEFACARLRLRAGRTADARASYQAALAHDPSYGSPYNCDGRVELSRGRVGAARSAFADMLRLDSRDRHAHLGMASIATREKRWADTEAHARAALDCGSDGPDAHRLLAGALEARHRPADAVAALQRSLRAGLDGRPSVVGVIASRAGGRLPVQDRSHARTYATLGRLEARLGHSRDALAALTFAVAGGYRRPGVHLHLARLHAARRRWREVVAETAHAIALAPETLARFVRAKIRP